MLSPLCLLCITLVSYCTFVSCISEQERLINMVNDYRVQNGLPVVPASYWLTATGMLHTIDRRDKGLPAGCSSGHSWSSTSSLWNGCCYTSAAWECMCYKPREVSKGRFTGISYENWITGAGTAEAALAAWKGSPAHNSVILNLDGWAGTPWKSIGAGVCGGNFALWFSSDVDPDGGADIGSLTCSMTVNGPVPIPGGASPSNSAAVVASKSPTPTPTRSIPPVTKSPTPTKSVTPPSVTPTKSVTPPSVTPTHSTLPSSPPQPSFPKLWIGGLSVTSSAWSTVTMNQNFVKPVIVCSMYYTITTPALALRMRNVVDGGNTFQIQVVGIPSPFSTSVDVDCIAVEEGTYNVQQHGIKMEAKRVSSTVTSGKAVWGTGNLITYSNGVYQNPVVVGQVMSSNSVDWSVFYAHSSTSPLSPVSAQGTGCMIGKQIGEDPNLVRSAETLGYIVIEAGSGNWNTRKYSAIKAVGVYGVENNAPYTTPVTGITAALGVNSVNSVVGTDGGYSIFYGDRVSAYYNSGVAFAIDEDQILDAERYHASAEVVGTILFE